MKMQGTIDISLRNRPDGTPILGLVAVDKEGRKVLTRLHEALEVVWLLAIPKGKADIHNVCGSKSSCSKSEYESLTIPLALGGIGFRILFPKRKKVVKK